MVCEIQERGEEGEGRTDKREEKGRMGETGLKRGTSFE